MTATNITHNTVTNNVANNVTEYVTDKRVSTLTVVCEANNLSLITEKLTVINDVHGLSLVITYTTVTKINNKTLKQLFLAKTTSQESTNKEQQGAQQKDTQHVIILAELDGNNHIIASIYQQVEEAGSQQTVMKVRLDWHKLQRRIVTAGRKSELLLQACKLTAESNVIDATAGFGHDSLIMASSGAHVTMLENNPFIALLLLLERERMHSEKNWQGLMSRLTVFYGDLLDRDSNRLVDTHVDVVYLDPMFPHESYAGAKVSKGMQTLHYLAKPPTQNDEQALLRTANLHIHQGGRIVVKRPKNAPYLADSNPNESWLNDVVRFDGYIGE